MPTARVYGQRQIGTAALPGVRLTAAKTALSEGAGVAQAKANTFGAVANLAGGIASTALSVRDQMITTETKRADEVAMLDAGNQIDAWENKRLYDPNTGALTLHGKDAFGLPEQVNDEYLKLTGAIEKGLSTQEQRDAFQKLKANRGQNLDLTLRRHVFSEMQAYQGKELQSSVDNAVNDAMHNALDPARVGEALTRATDAIKTHAPQLGLGPEQVKEQVAATTSTIHVGVIDQLLANDQVSKAKVYFEETKDQIAGGQLARVEKALDTAGTKQQGLDASDAIWKSLGPKTETDPINLDAMESAAREQFKKDPEALGATIAFLRERKSGIDASRADRAEQTSGAVWIAASKGASLNQVSSMPEFRALPGRVQAQVSDYIVGKAEHTASLKATEENRAYTAENRAYLATQRADQVKERNGWTQYWNLSNPAVLDKTSENALQAMRGDLGDEHVNRLLTQKRSLSKTEDAVRAATIDDDLFKTTATAAGMNAYGTLDDGQKAALGQLKNTVETAIDVEQQRLGKLLTRDQKAALMTSIIDKKVMIDHWFGFSSESKIAATVTADERQNVYVPIAQIPAPALGEVYNYLRSMTPANARKSDAELLSTYNARIQYAYGRRMVGATRQEIEDILQGKK